MGRNMGSLYRRGKIWWLQVYQAGKTMRKSTGTSDKAEARRLLKEWEGQVTKGEAIPKHGKTTWDQASAGGTLSPRGSERLSEQAVRGC